MTNVAGHLREQNGMYQMILSWKDTDGKRRTKSISGVGFPEMGPQQPAQLGVAGIDLRALERQCAVIPLPGGENEISGHI